MWTLAGKEMQTFEALGIYKRLSLRGSMESHMWSQFTSKSVYAESAQLHILGLGKEASGEEQWEKDRDLRFKRENSKGWRDLGALKN